MDYFEQGRRAFRSGLKALDAPYPDWARRAPWIRGWYEAEHAARLATSRAQGKEAGGGR